MFGGDLRLSWRLLAANNRDVARSADRFVDLAGCLDAVRDLQSGIGSSVAVATRSGRADWSWRLRVNGVDVAVSSRTYQRRLQCEAACALFMSLVPGAVIDELHAESHARQVPTVTTILTPASALEPERDFLTAALIHATVVGNEKPDMFRP